MRCINKVMACMMWIVCKFYPHSLSERLRGFRVVLYTMWIRNFLNHIGERSIIASPCSLQGGGQKRIVIGDDTCIQSHCVLGCWEKYGDQRFSPSIIIGNHCNIGEYNHITACNVLNEGANLTECQVGILVSINSSETMVIQKVGILTIEKLQMN